jgi:hypothetical protein
VSCPFYGLAFGDPAVYGMAMAARRDLDLLRATLLALPR